MPAHPPIEQQEPPIDLANESLHLRAGDTHLTAHWDHLDTTRFDPAPDGDRVQAQLVGGSTYTQEFRFPLGHESWFPFLDEGPDSFPEHQCSPIPYLTGKGGPSNSIP